MAVVSLHLGQAGVQIGDAIWTQYCLEHCIGDTGRMDEKENPSTMTLRSGLGIGEISSGTTIRSGVPNPYDFGDSREVGEQTFVSIDGLHTFYQELSNNRFAPRALFIDMESTVIDQLRTGRTKGLFTPNLLINSIEDAANNYARGYCSADKKLRTQVEDGLRSTVELADKMQGFMIFHSSGGGTGSGYHALLAEHLNDEYIKCTSLDIEIFPSPRMSTAVVEPYNSILSKNATLDHLDCVFMADNEAMYNICQNKLGIESPNYRNLNRLLASTISSVTASLRFKGSLNADFIDFQTNLVPYPRVHFPIITYAPIVSGKKVAHETLSITDLTLQVFNPQLRMATCDIVGRYIACCLLYRGDVTPKDVNTAIAQIKEKKSVQFVDWSPTGFKVSINHKTAEMMAGGDMAAPRKTVCMLANTTAIHKCWVALNTKFNSMLKRRAFIHWYTGEGMQEDEFVDAQANILALEADYHCLE